MKKNRKTKQTYRSMTEFEKRFFPKSFEKGMAGKPADAQAVGASLAEDILSRVRDSLTNQVSGT